MKNRCKGTRKDGTRCPHPAKSNGLCGHCLRWKDNGAQERPRKSADKKPGPWDEIEGKCNGKKLGGDGLCRQPAGWGVVGINVGRCKRHGGATRNHRKAAQRQMAEQAVETYGLPRDIGPHEALLEEVHRTAGHVAWLEFQVREHDPDALVWGITKQTAGMGETGQATSSTEKAAKPSIWLVLYRQERQHLVDVCKTAIAAGIAERQVQLAEQQGALIAQVIRGVLEDLGVADHPDVAKTVRRHLVAIDGGKAA